MSGYETAGLPIVSSITGNELISLELPQTPTSPPQTYCASVNSIVSASPAMYLGQVATRGMVPTAFYAPNKQLMARSRHIARDGITSLQLVYSNWFVNESSNGIEQGSGAPFSITASVEYPVGTFTQVTFGGVASGTVASGANQVSDPVAVSIPRGAVFFVRTWQSGTAGIIYRDVGVCDTGNGEAMAFGASGIADQTMGGTITNQQAGLCYAPSAIIAQTRRPSVWVAGDSRAAGSGDSFDDATSDMGELARAVGPNFGYINAGKPADRVSWAIANYTKRLSLSAYCSHVICNLGVNDLYVASRSGAQVLADQQTFYALFGGKPVIQNTIWPETTSTDSWATTANQTAVSSSANNQRIALNNSIRSVPVGLVGVLEHADVVETTRASGLFNAPGWTTDGIHGTATLYRAVKSASEPRLLGLIKR